MNGTRRQFLESASAQYIEPHPTKPKRSLMTTGDYNG
jgi:hypothetical protein